MKFTICISLLLGKENEDALFLTPATNGPFFRGNFRHKVLAQARRF